MFAQAGPGAQVRYGNFAQAVLGAKVGYWNFAQAFLGEGPFREFCTSRPRSKNRKHIFVQAFLGAKSDTGIAHKKAPEQTSNHPYCFK